jgi:site-specific recombinase XerD
MELLELLADWSTDLQAARKSANTIRVYRQCVRAYVRDTGVADVCGLTRRSARSWLAAMQERGLRPATQEIRYTVLDMFCKWLVAEQIMADNPMAGLTRPASSPVPVEPFSPEEIAALLKACEGWSFTETRDTAIIRMLLSTGMRRTELATITLDRIDMAERVVTILGKGTGGGTWRVVPYDAEAATALRRYMRKRRGHRLADSEYLWLGQTVATFSGHGVGEMLERRARQAGLTGVHAHRFRNTFACAWLAEGGGEMTLRTIAGWSSNKMLGRYTAARSQQNALAEYRRRRG